MRTTQEVAEEILARYDLTSKQRAFVLAFVGDAKGNATLAARMAGYSDNPRSLRVIAYQTLKKPNVAEAIEALTQVNLVDIGTIYSRLLDQAMGPQEFLHADENGAIYLDFEAMKRAGKAHLVKKFANTRYGQSIEFYDAQVAMDKALSMWARVAGIVLEQQSGVTEEEMRDKFELGKNSFMKMFVDYLEQRANELERKYKDEHPDDEPPDAEPSDG